MKGGIQIDRDDRGIVTFHINNPAHRNALNDDMIAALTAAFKAAAEDRHCRIVVLRGTGGIFCAGREINDIQALQGAGMDVLNAAYARLLELNLAAYYCPKPVVSVLERYALGAGIMIAGWSAAVGRSRSKCTRICSICTIIRRSYVCMCPIRSKGNCSRSRT